MKRWKKISHENRNKKKAEIVIIISGKIDIKTKTLTRDKKGHYIMIKGSNQQDNITLENTCAPNIRATKYIKQVKRNKGRNR